jgi:hypothetical protein
MNEDRLDTIKEGYSFEDWRGANQLGEHLFIYNVYQHPPHFEGWELHQSQLLSAPGQPPAVISTWKQVEAPGIAVLRSELYECSSRLRAHELLVERLAQFQSVEVVRLEPPPVGDVAFTGPGEGFVLFARANLLFFIANARPEQAPVLPLARQLDAELIARPEKPDAGPPRLARRSAAPAKVEATAGRATPLTPALADAPGRDPGVYYKVFSDKGEVSLQDEELAFEAGEAGPGQIQVYTIRGDAPPWQQNIDVTVGEE